MISKVLVLPTRYLRGWDGDEDELPKLPRGTIVDLRKALTDEYDTDAHFVQYAVPSEESPRLNKSAARWFAFNAPDQSPTLTTIAVDIDLPEHGRAEGWDSPALVGWIRELDAKLASIPEVEHAGQYRTRGGMRLVWPLAHRRQIGVNFAESYIEQFLDYLLSFGLPQNRRGSGGVDRLTDWTRLFRLPKVKRDGEQQKLDYDFGKMAPLDWDPPRPLEDRGLLARGRAARTDMPPPEEIPKWRVSTLAPLKHKPYYEGLRNKLPFAAEGDRHLVSLKLIGSMVSTLDTNDPLIPFSMLIPSAEAANYPLAELWGVCVWVCQVHDGARQILAEEKDAALVLAAEQMGCEPEDVPQRLILTARIAQQYYVWDEITGRYQRPTGQAALLPNLLEACSTLTSIAPSTPTAEILRNHATAVDRTVLSYNATRVVYHAHNATLVEPAAPIDTSLVPKEDGEIAGWLAALFGAQVEQGLDWLATFLRLDRATCALYIHGPPSIGKGMFALGLARFWNTAPTPYAELLGSFQQSLIDCPLIVADEKVPEDAFSENDSSVFRRIVGTGSMKVSRKFLAPAQLEGYPRVLITANNADALRIREALDAADIEAVQKRIGYIETTDAAEVYLRDLAASKGIAVQDMTQEWVTGGGIAKHVAYLAATRHVTIGDRFLVEGWSSSLTDDLAIKFGSAPLLGKFVARVIRDKMQLNGIVWGSGEVWCNLDAIRESWQIVMGRSSKVPGDQTLMKALKVLSDGKSKRMAITPTSSQRYFWSIAPGRLARIAEEFFVTDAQTILSTIAIGPVEDAPKVDLNALFGIDTANDT